MYHPHFCLLSLRLKISIKVNTLQTFLCWFPHLFCLWLLYMEWPSHSTPKLTLSEHLQIQYVSFSGKDLPCLPHSCCNLPLPYATIHCQFHLFVNCVVNLSVQAPACMFVLRTGLPRQDSVLDKYFNYYCNDCQLSHIMSGLAFTGLLNMTE